MYPLKKTWTHHQSKSEPQLTGFSASILVLFSRSRQVSKVFLPEFTPPTPTQVHHVTNHNRNLGGQDFCRFFSSQDLLRPRAATFPVCEQGWLNLIFAQSVLRKCWGLSSEFQDHWMQIVNLLRKAFHTVWRNFWWTTPNENHAESNCWFDVTSFLHCVLLRILQPRKDPPAGIEQSEMLAQVDRICFFRWRIVFKIHLQKVEEKLWSLVSFRIEDSMYLTLTLHDAKAKT